MGDDRDGLVALYDYTKGPTWKNRFNWRTEERISVWWGVKLDCSGHVLELTLDDNRLRGPFPDNNRWKALVNVRVLSLSSNQLTGSIPKALQYLVNLETLNLSWNKFEGIIPNELYGLKTLKTIRLDNNCITGVLSHSICNLKQLNQLNLSNNKLSGPAPLISLIQIPQIFILDLSRNNFTNLGPTTQLGAVSECLDFVARFKSNYNDLLPLVSSILCEELVDEVVHRADDFIRSIAIDVLSDTLLSVVVDSALFSIGCNIAADGVGEVQNEEAESLLAHSRTERLSNSEEKEGNNDKCNKSVISALVDAVGSECKDEDEPDSRGALLLNRASARSLSYSESKDRGLEGINKMNSSSMPDMKAVEKMFGNDLNVDEKLLVAQSKDDSITNEGSFNLIEQTSDSIIVHNPIEVDDKANCATIGISIDSEIVSNLESETKYSVSETDVASCIIKPDEPVESASKVDVSDNCGSQITLITDSDVKNISTYDHEHMNKLDNSEWGSSSDVIGNAIGTQAIDNLNVRSPRGYNGSGVDTITSVHVLSDTNENSKDYSGVHASFPLERHSPRVLGGSAVDGVIVSASSPRLDCGVLSRPLSRANSSHKVGVASIDNSAQPKPVESPVNSLALEEGKKDTIDPILVNIDSSAGEVDRTIGIEPIRSSRATLDRTLRNDSKLIDAVRLDSKDITEANSISLPVPANSLACSPRSQSQRQQHQSKQETNMMNNTACDSKDSSDLIYSSDKLDQSKEEIVKKERDFKSYRLGVEIPPLDIKGEASLSMLDKSDAKSHLSSRQTSTSKDIANHQDSTAHSSAILSARSVGGGVGAIESARFSDVSELSDNSGSDRDGDPSNPDNSNYPASGRKNNSRKQESSIGLPANDQIDDMYKMLAHNGTTEFADVNSLLASVDLGDNTRTADSINVPALPLSSYADFMLDNGSRANSNQGHSTGSKAT